METIHNCTCLPKTFAQGEEHHGCVYGAARRTKDDTCPIVKHKDELKSTCGNSEKTKWCQIAESDCGYYNPTNPKVRWDYCEYPLKFIENETHSETIPLVLNKREHILGTILFFLIFGLSIPYYFMKKGWIELIEVWITNLDLLATCLSFRSGLFNTKLFSYLYRMTAQGSVAYWSTMLVNYAALLGVCMVVAHRVYQTKSITHGWCVAMIMLPITYLMPNHAIKKVIESVSWKLENYLLQKHVKFTYFINRLLTIIPIIVGLILALGFIMIEKLILKTQIKRLKRFADVILKPLKLKTIKIIS